MARKHICPVCGGNRFSTTAHVMQDWIVNEYGHYEKILDGCLQIDAPPDDDNIWTCINCGAEAVIVKE